MARSICGGVAGLTSYSPIRPATAWAAGILIEKSALGTYAFYARVFFVCASAQYLNCGFISTTTRTSTLKHSIDIWIPFLDQVQPSVYIHLLCL